MFLWLSRASRAGTKKWGLLICLAYGWLFLPGDVLLLRRIARSLPLYCFIRSKYSNIDTRTTMPHSWEICSLFFPPCVCQGVFWSILGKHTHGPKKYSRFVKKNTTIATTPKIDTKHYKRPRNNVDHAHTFQFVSRRRRFVSITPLRTRSRACASHSTPNAPHTGRHLRARFNGEIRAAVRNTYRVYYKHTV